MSSSLKVCIIGAGINGVTCAYQIKHAHPYADVTIVAESFTPKTTSDAAAGYWRPPSSDYPEMELKYLKWGEDTKNFIVDAVYNDKDANLKGLLLCHGYRVSEDQLKLPYWKDIALNLMMVQQSKLSIFPPFVKSAYSYTAPVTEGSKFLPYYMNLFRKMNGKIIQQKISSIEDLYNDYDVIINCSGVGARKVSSDKNVFPIRGYVLRVHAPWVKEFVYNLESDKNDKTTYIYPLQDSVLLGGYKQSNDWRKEILPQEREDLLKDAARFIPSLANTKIISEHVGFRPGRSKVRLELENIGENKAVIHNYGHGGNGLSLYWGCSLDVLNLFNKFLQGRIGMEKSKL